MSDHESPLNRAHVLQVMAVMTTAGPFNTMAAQVLLYGGTLEIAECLAQLESVWLSQQVLTSDQIDDAKRILGGMLFELGHENPWHVPGLH